MYRFCSMFIATVLFLAASGFVSAQESPLSEEEQQVMLQQILDTLDQRDGTISLADGLATLNVPNTFYFLDAEDAETVLVTLWGNPPGQRVLGMLVPAGVSVIDEDSWAVTVDYLEEGYVSDEDAADIDYDELLRDMQRDTRDANKARSEAGYGSIELVGWAERPRYDENNKKLYWAKEIRFEGSQDTTLNYEIRALGRQGILTMTFIAATSQLAEINRRRDAVLGMVEFSPGNQYADFDPDLDKVAAYGIGALIAGKVAAKAGLLAAGLLLLKKFGIFLVLGLAFVGRSIMGLFKKPRPDQS